MSLENIAAILADTKAHGFTFNSETVKHDGRSYPAEILVVVDLGKFDHSFPGVALGDLNGSSTRVRSQAVSRNARGKQTPAQLREANVKTVLLGIEETKTVYLVKIDGEWMEFDSQEEADQASEELQETAEEHDDLPEELQEQEA